MALSVLVVGGGGREHALVWKLAQSPRVKSIFVTPGNGGTIGPNIFNVVTKTNEEIASFAKKEGVNFVVVGPEVPLAEGLADELGKAQVPCFGPSKAAARIESSKAFAKDFMKRHNIPTANYQSFTSAEEAMSYIENAGFDVVVKASGLAAGKGVVVPKTKQEAKDAVNDILVKKVFGNAGATVVLEERLVGPEASFLAFSDGKHFFTMPVAQDHKRVGDGDKGPNTGGMGAFAPSPTVDNSTKEYVERTIIAPAIKGMAEEGFPFVGVLYAGVMLTPQGPKTLEYNCRFGDPETQVLLPLLKTDLTVVIEACLKGTLNEIKVEFDEKLSAVTVVAASEGYPNDYPKGLPITLSSSIRTVPRVHVFHAGTTLKESQLVTSGGRVLAVTGVGNSFKHAAATAYEAIQHVHFEGMQFRKDIGAFQMPKVRIGILGSTRGTDMQAIIDAINDKIINATISMVISNVETAYILERAKTHNVPHKFIPSKGQTRQQFEEQVASTFLSVGDVDIVLLIGFMRIISPFLIGKYEGKMLNVHPSLLPKFAGGMDMDVHAEVIKAKETVSGCTVHFVTTQVDGGDHVMQMSCPIAADETSESLKAKVQKLEGFALIECIRKFQQGSLKAIPKKSVTYSEAGVDIERGSSLVENIKPFARDTARPGTTSALGGKSFFDLKATGYQDPILVSGTDGVGTKLEIAKIAGNHSTIGIDLVAMCVNDVLVHGAEPLFFLDYFATGKLNVAEATEVVKGIAHACKESGCALTGGETAEMPGLYKAGDYDLAGFCVGAVERNQLLPKTPSDIEVGDLIVGIAASGFHSNGYSLVRHLIKTNNVSMTDPPPFRHNNHRQKQPTYPRICDALLEPTKLYVKAVLPLLKAGLVKGASHITGGGLLENVPRVFGKGGKSGKAEKGGPNLHFKLDMAKWEVSDMYKWMVKLGGLEEKEAMRTFNCGIGFVLIISPKLKEKVLDSLKTSGESAWVIGEMAYGDSVEGEVISIENAQILKTWKA